MLFSNFVGAGGLGANGEAVNPYFDSSVPFAAWRAGHPNAPLRYLVSRLAGFQTPLDPASGIPVDVKSLIDCAQAPAGGGTVLVDEDPQSQPGRRAGNFQGITAIESFYRSVPYLSWMNLYVGDPLMTSTLRVAVGDDLDGDGDVDGDDATIASLSLFLPPGPRGTP